MMGERQTPWARSLAVLEVPALLAVPAAMVALAAAGVPATAGLTLAVALLAVGLVLASFEASRPALRQLMPTAVLAAVAAAGRVLFSPLPDVKPVSAVAIVAGATLGRRSGFVVGALAALLSNFFFGQGPWTPWQMYAWGLVGYVGGVLGERGLLERPPVLYGWGLLSGLVYGLFLNGHASGAVALVGDLGVVGGVGAGAKGLVDGGLDLGVGHGDHAGAGHGGGEGRVVVRVGVAAELGRDGDVTRELGEERRALGVDGRLLVLGTCPLRVSGHAHPLRQSMA